MKTIDDALRWADTFDSPHSKHMSLVMLAAEVRRLRGELDGLTVQRDAMLEQLKMSREVIAQQAAALKEAQEQKPVVFFPCDWKPTRGGGVIGSIHADAHFKIPLYASPVPSAPTVAVPAVPTDEQIHAAYRKALGQSIRERDMPEIRKFSHSLLQSTGDKK